MVEGRQAHATHEESLKNKFTWALQAPYVQKEHKGYATDH